MKRAFVVLWSFAIAIAGVGGLYLGAHGLGSGTGVGPAILLRDAPWPYCYPDAVPPSYATPASPHLFPEPEAQPAVEPIATAIIRLDSITSVGGSALGQVAEVVWPPDVAAAPDRFPLPLKEREWRLDADPGMWAAVAEQLKVGDVFVGVSTTTREGDLAAEFALGDDHGSLIFLGDGAAVQRYSAILQDFVSSGYNPMKGASARDLLKAWNAEAHSGPEYPAAGEIRKGWLSFIENQVLGRGEPIPGSAEWWHAAPSYCRSVEDAPMDLRSRLVEGQVWIRLSPEWQALKGAVVCLSVQDFASLGCALLDSSAPSSYVDFGRVLVPSGAEMNIELARLLTEDSPSWVDRKVVGTVPWETLTQSRWVLVTFEGEAPATYTDVSVAGGLAVSQPLSTSEESAIAAAVAKEQS